VDVNADGKTEAFTITWPQGLTRTYFLHLELRDSSGTLITDNLYWLSTVPESPSKTGYAKEGGFTVNRDSWADLTGLRELPEVAVDATAGSRGEGSERVVEVTLGNPSKDLAFAVRLAVHKGTDGGEVAPCYWNDNLVSVLPGTTRTALAVFNESELEGKAPVVKIEGWNVPAQVLDAN
jgi:exo-1,4-beta-D-glucosaminidase